MQLWRYGQAIEQLGERYKLVGSLGSGGVADVCLAWDVQENCERAVKVFQPEVLDAETLQRFSYEGSLIAGWNYPGIVHMYGEVQFALLDVPSASAVPYTVMEYLRGGNLQQRLQENQPLLLEDIVRVFSQVCRAVQYAHDRDIVHRCLNPANILFRQPVDGPEQIVVSDFGLAFPDVSNRQSTASADTLTYLAPEQWRGESLPASDIFALGVLLYRFCTGCLPFHEPVQPGQWTLPVRPGSIYAAFPPALDAIILTALAENPTQRHPSALAFWESVRAVTRPARPSFLTSLMPGVQAQPARSMKSVNAPTVGDSGSLLVARMTFPDPILPTQPAWASNALSSAHLSDEALLALLLQNEKVDPTVQSYAASIDTSAPTSTKREVVPPLLVISTSPLPTPAISMKKRRLLWLKNKWRIVSISLIVALIILIAFSLLLHIH